MLGLEIRKYLTLVGRDFNAIFANFRPKTKLHLKFDSLHKIKREKQNVQDLHNILLARACFVTKNKGPDI